jgi:hypothetical protein
MNIFVKHRQQRVAIAIVLSGVLVAFGTVLPWARLQTVLPNLNWVHITVNGFDGGYVTGSSPRDGNDGLIVLLLGLAVALLGAHYFFGGDLLAGVVILAFALGASTIAAYEIFRLHGEQAFAWTCTTEGSCTGHHSWGLARFGLYLIMVAGLIATIASLVGLLGMLKQRPSAQRANANCSKTTLD